MDSIRQCLKILTICIYSFSLENGMKWQIQSIFQNKYHEQNALHIFYRFTEKSADNQSQPTFGLIIPVW